MSSTIERLTPFALMRCAHQLPGCLDLSSRELTPLGCSDGLFKLCISHSATGLFFVILVATLSHLASIYGAQRGYYVNVNSAGEFAPATSGSAWSGPGRAAPSWSNPNARQAPQTEWYDEKSPLLS
eukprot:m.70564 g.70564  ORF g.70564 m.70564 type:complete len:126 (+) comp7886_c0_seq1:1110-1487(+)